jgi:hypothetical protein
MFEHSILSMANSTILLKFRGLLGSGSSNAIPAPSCGQTHAASVTNMRPMTGE